MAGVIGAGKSTLYNTTLANCGRTIFGTIQKAISLGYVIEMHYVGLDNVELAKERVRKRVANGGHGIAEEDIERRYIESNNNFSKVIGECDLIAVL